MTTAAPATHNATTATPATSNTVDLRRIAEDDRDYTRLHTHTVAALSASLRQLVRELRHSASASQPHDETPILSAFIARHTAILRDAYVAAHGEGVRDYYDTVSLTPARCADAARVAPSHQQITRRLSFYAPSVAKMAHEALLAWHAEKSGGRVTANELDAATIRLSGHLPGYTQNRQAGGKFGVGDGPQESSGGSGGGGGPKTGGAKGGAGSGGGAGSRSGSRSGRVTKSTTAVKGAPRPPRAPTVPKALAKPAYEHVGHDAQGNPIKGGGGSRSGKSGESKTPKPAATEGMHERSARLQHEGGLAQEAQPGTHLSPVRRDETARIDLTRMPSAQQVLHVYGEHQFGLAISNYTKGHLTEMARAEGVQPGRSRAETVSRITAHVTEGRYSANFGATGAAKAGAAKSGAGAANARGGTRASRAKATYTRPALVPIIHDPTARIHVSESITPHELLHVYGAHQLRSALSGFSRSHLTAWARELGVKPGRSNAQAIEAIATALTGGGAP